jgi:hypothetical protein
VDAGARLDAAASGGTDGSARDTRPLDAAKLDARKLDGSPDTLKPTDAKAPDAAKVPDAFLFVDAPPAIADGPEPDVAAPPPPPDTGAPPPPPDVAPPPPPDVAPPPPPDVAPPPPDVAPPPPDADDTVITCPVPEPAGMTCEDVDATCTTVVAGTRLRCICEQSGLGLLVWTCEADVDAGP